MALPRVDLSDPALGRRLASGAVLAVVALVGVALGGWPFTILVLAAVALMAREWAGLAGGAGPAGQAVIFVAALAAPVWAVVWTTVADAGGAVGGLGVAAVVAAGVAAALAKDGISRAGVGVLYIGLPSVALVWLRHDPDHGGLAILWLLLVVWATDIVAYFVGRSVGGPKLAPRISPGKTWSGLIGGMAGAALVGLVAAWLMDGAALGGAALGAILAVVAQAGDLFESWAKRMAGVKDSGTLIPGHGGILDRVDGLLFAAPAFAALVAVMGAQVAR
jgi:phosphatidate cytidylyltransferase